MLSLKGNRVRLATFDHKWVADLMEFEGPLLTLMKESTYQDYLYFWCDSSKLYNRWLVIDVTRKELERYGAGKMSLRAIANSKDLLHFVDIDEVGKARRTWEVVLDSVPQEYLPRESSFFDATLSNPDAIDILGKPAAFSLKLDGKLFLDDVHGIAHAFDELYQTVYAIEKSKKRVDRSSPELTIGSLPWKGGFSALHAFRRLGGEVPSYHEARVMAVSYGSPGSIQMELLKAVATETLAILNAIDINATNSQALSNEIGRFARDNRWKDIDASSPNLRINNDSRKFIEVNLNKYADLLGLGAYVDAIRAMSGNDLVAIKFLRSFHRKAKKFLRYRTRGQIKL